MIFVKKDPPISLYIFVLVQQLLFLLMDHAVLNTKIKPFSIKGIMLFHLIFANDIIRHFLS